MMWFFPLAADVTAAGQSALLASVLLIALGLVEVIKYLVKNWSGKPKEKPATGLTSSEREALFCNKSILISMEKILMKTDDDGVPMVYMPRGFAKDMVETQRQLAKTMDFMATLMERWDRERTPK